MHSSLLAQYTPQLLALPVHATKVKSMQILHCLKPDGTMFSDDLFLSLIIHTKSNNGKQVQEKTYETKCIGMWNWSISCVDCRGEHNRFKWLLACLCLNCNRNLFFNRTWTQQSDQTQGHVEVNSRSAWQDFRRKVGLLVPYMWPRGSVLLQGLVMLCVALLCLERAINVFVPIYSRNIGKTRCLTREINLKIFINLTHTSLCIGSRTAYWMN